MTRFLLRRLATMTLMLMVAAGAVFIVLEILPGDPAATMLGISATVENVAALRAELGLDRPAPVRFLSWVGGIFSGDLGLSYSYRVPVGQLVGERLAVTVPLALLAQFLAVVIGVSLGVMAASKANTPLDAAIMAISQLGVAVPNFVFGILLVLLFAVTLGWLPSGGFPGWTIDFSGSLRSLILPAMALALPQSAILARITRSAMLEALSEDYVRTARAKGLTRGQTIRRHALPNALVPVITMLGLQFSFLVTGTIIIENVFALPGLGRLLIQGIGGHDIIVIKSLVLLFVGAVIVINAAVDIAYGVVDPRLRKLD